MKKILLAAFLALAPCVALAATDTVNFSISSTSTWTDLGAGPARVELLNGVPVTLTVASTTPAAGLAGHQLNVNQKFMDFQTTDHVWAVANSANPATLAVSALSGLGSGGGLSVVDQTPFTYGASPFTPIGCVYNSSITVLSSGTQGVVSCDTNRELEVSTLAGSNLANILANPPNALGQTAEQTAVTTGTNVPFEATLTGKLVTLPYSTTGNTVNLAPAGKTDTSAITIFAASGSASQHEYMTSIQIGRSDAGTTAVTATVTDGTLSFLWVVPNSGGGGGNNITFPVPIQFALNHAVTCASSGSVTTFTCYAQGFNAP